jgi:hypothetical protein
MSEIENIKGVIPKVIIGGVKYSSFGSIPEQVLLRKIDSLLTVVKRGKEAGVDGCLFYLYNDEMIQFLNLLHEEIPDFPIMIVVKSDDINFITTQLRMLNFKPLAIFLDYSLSDQRDNDLINKYTSSLSKFCDYIGIYSLDPIGSVSFFITSNPEVKLFMFPFNMLGAGLQNRSLMEMIVNSSENIYVSSNPLADRKIKPRQAFDYITTHRIHSALIELGDLEVVLESIKYAKYYFETHDFLQIALEFEDHSEVCENCGLGMSRYYPPSGGSWWYCPQCQDKKEATQ